VRRPSDEDYATSHNFQWGPRNKAHTASIGEKQGNKEKLRDDSWE
jgi:hypothetical protein